MSDHVEMWFKKLLPILKAKYFLVRKSDGNDDQDEMFRELVLNWVVPRHDQTLKNVEAEARRNALKLIARVQEALEEYERMAQR